MRESGKAIGASVGRMIFAGRSTERIQQRLDKVGGEKLAQALSKRGLGGLKNEDIAKALTGESRGRAGWSQGKMKNVVAALQDAGLAHTEKSASHMLLQASKNLQPQQKEIPGYTPEQEARFKAIARERRKEATAEETEESGSGILDRMRGAVGRVNKQAVPSETVGNAAGSIKLKPRIAAAKPKKEDTGLTGFQA